MHTIITIETKQQKCSIELYLDNLNGSSRGDEKEKASSSKGEVEEQGISDHARFERKKREWCEAFKEFPIEKKVSDEINKADYCGKTYAKFTDVDTETKTAYKQLKCFKWWCPTCGGRDGAIHKQKNLSVLKRIDVEDYFIRQFVFTVPDYLRDKFKSKKMITSLLSLVERLIEREFGDYIGDKKNGKGRFKERKYRLTKPVVAYLHLDGEGMKFNPHVNVHIFEKHDQRYKLPKEKLKRISKSYRKALKHLLRETIGKVNCHYSYKVGTGNVRRAIHYMSKPTDREMIYHIDFDLQKLLCHDLKRMRFVRFWGEASNSKFKDGKRADKKPSRILEINREIYKFVGILSQDEFEAETAGKRLSCSLDGLITILDDLPYIGTTG
jgi:hypothetical protein